jgi:alpha,alpha-trehalase
MASEDTQEKISSQDNWRRSSTDHDYDPYQPPDLYYGPITDPLNRQSKFGRMRTRSMFVPKPSYPLPSFATQFTEVDLNSNNNNDYKNNAQIEDNKNSAFNFKFSSNSSVDGITTSSGLNNGLSSNSNLNLNQSTSSVDSVDFKALQKLKYLNLSSSSDMNTPVISDSDDDDDLTSDDDDAVSSLKSHSTGSLVANSDFIISNENIGLDDYDIKKPIPDRNKINKKTPSPFTKSNQIPFPTSSPLSSTRPLKKDLPIFNRDRLSPSPSSPTIRRRASADMSSSKVNSKRFFISDIDSTLNELLRNEDTDHNCQITIEDTGPKVLKLGTANSGGIKQYDIRGTYMLSNLLQELTIAKRFGRKQMILDEARLNENPVSRLYRLITTSFWKNLTRQVDENSILEMAKDTKIHSEEAKFPRIYVPFNEKEQFYYYSKISEKHKDYNLKVEYLPKDINADYVKSINNIPGILALAVRHRSDKYGDLEGYPYVVPGGRFNEQYGWDSYFETLGLLSCDNLEPCIGMCENFIFEINHYGKILNANRSYYLCRSQPPFLTDMSLKIFNYINHKFNKLELNFLKRATLAAIKEYYEVWCSSPRLDPISGLSTFHPDGKGIPPETESGHFYAVLKPYCEKYNLTFKEFQVQYNDGKINEPSLDEYFLHDRAVRESGHDTSYRLEGICADLATVDLNCLLYKYEKDFAFIIKTYFNNELIYNDEIQTTEKWEALSEKRKYLIEKYMWNEKESLYFDYDIKTKKQSTYESITSFYVLWANLCSPERADTLINDSLCKFEAFGGLVSGTEKSRGEIGVSKPSRQWDYPYAWAPHQILVWEGLKNYNKQSIVQRLSYRWLYLMTLAFVDFNGIVVEKYDATSERQPHKVEAEYGNQGSGFKGVATEGFGWVNASFLLGLQNVDILGKRALGLVTSPTDFFAKMNPTEKDKYGLVCLPKDYIT